MTRNKATALLTSAFLFFSFVPAFAAPERLSDEQLLDLIQRKAFDYFVKEANPANGLVRDRAHNFSSGQTPSAASIAAVGFALTAYGVGVERGWIDRATAREKTLRTLEFFLNRAPQEHGFFYHFLDMKTGERAMKSEISPIDTALLLGGILFAAEFYGDPKIQKMAFEIYRRVDWTWMMNGGETLAMAWSPEAGFSIHRWDSYNESLMMYFMAMASPTHPVPASAWKAIDRPAGSYAGYRLISIPPLFTHQYSHIWVDFRNQNDGFADYFQNSVNATLANRQFCIDESRKFKTYGPDSWGLTASDGPGGYRAFGASPGWADHDGTVAPTACGSSIVFTPRESLRCLRFFYETQREKLWGLYGFSDAFNLEKNWYGHDVIGIDQGPLLLMIENYRSELIWKTMSPNKILARGFKKAGFKPGTLALPWPDPPTVKAVYHNIQADGYLKDWPNGSGIRLHTAEKEDPLKPEKDFKAEIRFAWDENALYFYLRAVDDSFVARTQKRNIWQDDVLELYIDPEGDGMEWKNPKDFELGFRANPGDNSVATWAWFQELDPAAEGDVTAHGYVYQNGYMIEGAVAWRFLGIRPQAGMNLRLSPSVHDMDRDRSHKKYDWFSRNEDQYLTFQLGQLILEGEPEKKSSSA